MALTKISTDGVKDDAITKAKIPADQIEASELANNAVDTNAIQDEAVTLAKLEHGDANNNGKFLRANNGADPTFETVNTTPADGSITEAMLANNAVTHSKIADTAISQAKLNFPVSNKNVVINGECLIAQRATSETGVSGSANFSYNTVDRFVYGRNTDAVVNLAQEDDAPVGFKKCLQLRVTTAATSTSYARIVYRIEDTDVYRFGFGESGTRFLTLSFYHKHTQAGTNCVMIQNPGYNRSYIAEYTQSVANTWERATITFPVDTGNHWSPVSGRGMQIQWGLTNADAVGSANAWTSSNIVVTSNQYNHLGAVDNYFRLTGIQLELGSTATDFEHKSFAVEERLCKRYFCKYDSPLNINFVNEHANNKKGYLHFPYEEVMRDTPSVAFSNVNIGRPQVSVGISITEAQNIQRRCFNLVGWPNGSTLGSHGDAYYRMTISSGGYVTCDAEL